MVLNPLNDGMGQCLERFCLDASVPGTAVLWVDSQLTRNISTHAVKLPESSQWVWDRELFRLLTLAKDAGCSKVCVVWSRGPASWHWQYLDFDWGGEYP